MTYADFNKVACNYELARQCLEVELCNTVLEQFTAKVHNTDLLARLVLTVCDENYGRRYRHIINQNDFERWNVSRDTVVEDTLNRLNNAEIEYINLENLLQKLDSDGIFEQILGDDAMVLSLKNMLYGSSIMVKKGAFEEFKERFEYENRYILVIPSSKFELILYSIEGNLKENSWDIARVNDAIRHVNRTIVKPENCLSDHCYIYDFDLKTWAKYGGEKVFVME